MNLSVLIRHSDFRAVCLFMGRKVVEVTAIVRPYTDNRSNGGLLCGKWDRWKGKWERGKPGSILRPLKVVFHKLCQASN